MVPSKVDTDVFAKLICVVPNKIDVFAQLIFVVPNKMDVFAKLTFVVPNKIDVFAKLTFVVWWSEGKNGKTKNSPPVRSD